MASPSKNLASPLRELPGAADDRPIWRKLLPFGIALALTVALLLRLDLQAFVAHLRQVNYPGFLAFCGGFVLLLLTADVFATSWVYSKTICPVSFRELFLIRGASYLPSVVNHHIGQAWLTWYLARVYRAPLWRVAGATLLVYATVFASLFALGTVSLLLGSDAAGWLAPLVAIGATAGVAYLIVIHLRPRFLASRLILAPLFDVGVIGHLQALALRIPHVTVLFFGTWIPFKFFGVDIPPDAAFAYIPVLMVVAALPITPQGVGTRDWFSQHYFAQHGPGSLAEQQAAVAASTLSFAVALSLFQVILALALMQRALRMVAQRTSTRPDAAPPEHAAPHPEP